MGKLKCHMEQAIVRIARLAFHGFDGFLDLVSRRSLYLM